MSFQSLSCIFPSRRQPFGECSESPASVCAASSSPPACVTEPREARIVLVLLLSLPGGQSVVIAQEGIAVVAIVAHGAVPVEQILQHLVHVAGIGIVQIENLDNLPVSGVAVELFDHRGDLGHQSARCADQKGRAARVGDRDHLSLFLGAGTEPDWFWPAAAANPGGPNGPPPNRNPPWF